MKRLDDRDAFVARVRTIQGTYPAAHNALRNWGRWSGDQRGIFPKQSSPSIGYCRSEGEEYGEETAPDAERRARLEEIPRKSEPMDRIPYDEKSAVILDERIHHAGGLGVDVRIALRVAYVSREIPEDQFPRRTGCLEDTFCERLEEALRFTRRFV